MYEVPTPEELRAFMIENNLTGADTSTLTGVNPRTARRWVAPADQKGARPIPWSDWILILLLTGKISIEKVIAMIGEWKTEKTKSGRPLFERGAAGRPMKEPEPKEEEHHVERRC